MFLDKSLERVGPGWQTILKALDAQFVVIANRSKTRCELRILQVKEKLGGLRVYINPIGFSEADRAALQSLTALAEGISLKICEKCGSQDGVETRSRKGKIGRLLTLCAKCHEERDKSEIFQIGTSTV